MSSIKERSKPLKYRNTLLPNKTLINKKLIQDFGFLGHYKTLSMIDYVVDKISGPKNTQTKRLSPNALKQNNRIMFLLSTLYS